MQTNEWLALLVTMRHVEHSALARIVQFAGDIIDMKAEEAAFFHLRDEHTVRDRVEDDFVRLCGGWQAVL